MFDIRGGSYISVGTVFICNEVDRMIDVATLSDLQKQKLQRILEINKPITYGIISVSIGHDPMQHLRSLLTHT